MSTYNIINIREILYSVGDMNKVSEFFEGYGGWNRVGRYETSRHTMQFWNLPDSCTAEEILIQSHHVPNGQIRLIKFNNIDQKHIRSSQQPWDTGGIMDINLRVHEVESSFDALREMGFHGLSDPLCQEMGQFKLYDCLMKGYDDTIIAFTHRLKPPMDLPAPIKLPTHVYKTTITVKNLAEAKSFYTDILGCDVLSEYSVKKDSPQENMFGLPFNLADKVSCNAVILSIHGGKDTDFQIVEFDGVSGKDFSDRAMPPHRGFVLYRVEVENIAEYYREIQMKGGKIHNQMTEMQVEPYGNVQCFSVKSPNGVLWEFFESKEA